MQPTIILVTGANKGLGFEVVKKLVTASTDPNKTIILLGSRDIQRGQEAISRLCSPPNVHLLQLDTSSQDSIARATNEIKEKYNGHLDILINNAGIMTRKTTIDAAREVFATNYYGIKMINEYMFPLLQENGRIVNVSSEVGSWTLHTASSDLQNKYSSPTLTTEELDQLVKDFFSAIEQGKVDTSGYDSKWPMLIYGMSKAALTALTRIEARQWSAIKNILVLAVCPGYCATDATYHASGARPVEFGADSILCVVNTRPNELENGAFYQDGIKKSQVIACTVDLPKYEDPEKNKKD
ncbi:unnamed protein product [Rotaria sp. Silwood1]|nr:unnamed protein product [Rotaria sp. Silwood1]CAF1672640.1 unnamed protein product [Rotaria sp. Silwood1]CAF3929360.1 unnamed protein product [Rotaria sp. Silwood1]CAF4033048.1 unnamed protein product [Rotaria sp. Silwood1]CAF4990142.1 unnamed protein product [Rotaria sp. Silwood1]